VIQCEPSMFLASRA